MPTPTYRTPVRIARGTYASLNSSIADLLEGEVVYATDQDKVYVKEGGVLVSTQADLSSYLTSASAASTYLTQANASSTYLTTTAATSTYAPLSSPALTGTPTAPTATQGDVSTQIATTAYVNNEISHDLSAAIGTSIQAYDADTAKVDVAQSFTAPQRGSLTTLSISSGAVTINLNNTNNYYLDLNANVSSITFSNTTAGQTGSIFIKQSGTYTMGGWPAAAKFPGGTAPTITATAGKYDRVDYAIYDSSNVHLVWTGNY